MAMKSGVLAHGSVLLLTCCLPTCMAGIGKLSKEPEGAGGGGGEEGSPLWKTIHGKWPNEQCQA